MDFVVVDVETANQRPSSICQIGIACFCDGKLAKTWGNFVNPEDSFLPFNTELHGISPKTISKSPTWPDLQVTIRQFMEQRTIASHTFFDRAALNGANERYGLAPVPIARWVDTCKIARKTWPHLPSHKLTNLARTFGISYRAHNAVEDARCAGELLLLAANAAGLEIQELLASATSSSRADGPGVCHKGGCTAVSVV